MPISAPPPPPLLLTKRLTSFLHANLSSQIHTAALTTPVGKLLAHASAEPASTLRRQCAVAASLWALHAPESSQFGESVEAALPGRRRGSRAEIKKANIVTVQLDSGAVFIIRHLQCGMLFVCIGGGEGAGAPRAHGQVHIPGAARLEVTGGPAATATPPLGSPSEAASILSAGTTGAASHTTTGSTVTGMSPAAVLAMRRQVEELAKWLDERLGALSVPEEGIGFGPGSPDMR
ncbi:hypothetical protein GQ53DRAFT_751852 [Thozetella sp. PMI_491]|nr:hypothetical protein GQ53DRAFT_751852 [Thozetella sp. PMI_491]